MMEKQIKIYLAGEMNKKVERDIAPWRKNIINKFKENLNISIKIVNSYHGFPENEIIKSNEDFVFLCPESYGCDHGGIDPEETVKNDINLIEKSDLVIGYLNRTELYGTIVELMWAVNKGKSILLLIDKSLMASEDEVEDMKRIQQTNHSCNCMWQSIDGIQCNDYWFLTSFLRNYINNEHFKNDFKGSQSYEIVEDGNFNTVVDIIQGRYKKIGCEYNQEIIDLKKELDDDLNDLIKDNPNYKKSITLYRNQRDIGLIKKIKKENINCQICSFTFKKKNGENYNEVHHIIPLSENGKDEKINTLVVCANCHKQLHYANCDISKIKEKKIIVNGEVKIIK